MKNSTKAIAGIITAITALAQLPVIQNFVSAFLASHPAASAVFVGASSLFALFHAPKE